MYLSLIIFLLAKKKVGSKVLQNLPEYYVETKKNSDRTFDELIKWICGYKVKSLCISRSSYSYNSMPK